jgi:hypothetical protein
VALSGGCGLQAASGSLLDAIAARRTAFSLGATGCLQAASGSSLLLLFI